MHPLPSIQWATYLQLPSVQQADEDLRVYIQKLVEVEIALWDLALALADQVLNR